VTDASGSATELIGQWLEASPFVLELGISVEKIERDLAVLVLPFRQTSTTIADVVHGGALSSLIDTAATAAAWPAPRPRDRSEERPWRSR